MFRRFIPHQELPSFCHALAGRGELHGPAEHAGMALFRRLDDPADIWLDYGQSRLPPKVYVLPLQDTTLIYSASDGYRLPPLESGPLVLMGVHPCDLSAIAYLDAIFLHPEPDPVYAARRRRLILGGLSCEASDTCCCSPLSPAPAADFFMSRVASGYDLTATSPAGARLLKDAGFAAPLEAMPTPPLSPHPLPPPQADPDSYSGSPRWQEFAERCVGCGACSACCPTCFCFAVAEHPALTGGGAERLRSWDNCLFRRHGEVAGGANFRRSRLERLRYRFRHKYYGLGPHRGSFACVGCGRCLAVCPVDIDLSLILREFAP